MSFIPEDAAAMIGDAWMTSDGEIVRAYFLKFSEEGHDLGEKHGSIGTAVSRDLLHWKEGPEALLRGDGYREIWTGSTVVEGEKTYLFYTERSEKVPFAISLAISENGGEFVRYEKNPVMLPDERYYNGMNSDLSLASHANLDFRSYDMRDMFVLKDGERGCYWGYFVARVPSDNCCDGAVIGLARSADLVQWEQLPPCFAPKKYPCLETPDVFYMDGKWYMLCLTGNVYGGRMKVNGELYRRITIYAVADSPEGPFVEPEGNELIVSSNLSGFCAKTVEHNGARYLFYTQCGDEGSGVRQRLSLPHEVACEGGKLSLRMYDGLKNCLKSAVPVTESVAVANDGRFGSAIKDVVFIGGSVSFGIDNDYGVLPLAFSAKDFVFEAEITGYNTVFAGIVFDLKENIFFGGTVAAIDFGEGKVFVSRARDFAREESGKIISAGNKMKLTVSATGDAVEVYVDGKLRIHKLVKRSGGGTGLIVGYGKASFGGAVFRETDGTV